MPAPVKHIYWFAFYNLDSPSVRYRAYFPLSYLKQKAGIGFNLIMPGYTLKNIISFARVFFEILFFRKENSIIVIQKIRSDFIYSNLLKFLILFSNKGTIYDIDDADFLHYPPETIYHFIKNCRFVVAGSRELIKNIRVLNKNIHLNTSPVPDLKICKKYKNEILHIGWIGCYGGDHKKGLFDYIFPALKSIRFDLKLSIIGVKTKTDVAELQYYFEANKNIKLDLPLNLNWLDEEYIQKRISMLDVGIATLCDNEFHRSKSAFKVKQYLNCGVPVLSNNIPENNYFIVNNFNGFFFNKIEDVQKAIIKINFMSNDDYVNLSNNAISSSHLFNLDSYCNVLTNIFSEYEKNIPVAKSVYDIY